MHYSWDYAQQVHYPHHSQQVGPIYFKTPKKCEVFGVCCKGTGKQTFYLADEGQSPGKGANTVVSYVHHFLQHYGLGEETASFHFDNCAGQNKNNIVLQYAMWRVILGLHVRIHYGLMVAGHTKFAPDWHFGIWKAKWRYSDAESLLDIADSVESSSRSGHNIPHRVDDVENPVLFYDWKAYLDTYFKPLKNITKFQHFTVSSDKPGIVSCKMSPDSEEVDHNLLRRPSVLKDVKSVFPNQIHGAGLSAERQWYLFEEIGPFFYSEVARRAVCPEPTTPKTCKTIKYAEKNQTKVNTDRKQVKGHAQTDSSDKTKRKRKCQD